MDLNNKEQKFQKILSNAEFDLDVDQLWQDVDAELEDGKGKKRRFFFWIFSGTMILFLAFFSFQYFVGENTDFNNLEASVSSENHIHSDHSVVVETQSNINDIAKTHELNTKNPSKEKSVNKVEDKKENTSINSELVEDVKMQTSNNIENFTNTISQKIITKQPINNNNITGNIIKPNTLSISNLESINNKVTDSAQNNGSEIQTAISIEDQASLKLSVIGLAKIDFTVDEFFRASPESTIEMAAAAPIKVIKKATPKYYGSISFGSTIQRMNHVLNEMSDFNESEFERERAVPGLQAGITLGKYFAKGWSVFGSVGYAETVVRYSNFDYEITEATVQGTETIIIDALTGETAIEGELTEVTTKQNDIEWHRRHKTIDIGIGVSKEVVRIKRLSVVPHLGVLYNIHLDNSGYYFTEAGFTKPEGESRYVSNLGLGVNGGVLFDYTLGKISLGVDASYKDYFKGMLNETNFYNTKNSHFGLQFRVTYRPTWE